MDSFKEAASKVGNLLTGSVGSVSDAGRRLVDSTSVTASGFGSIPGTAGHALNTGYDISKIANETNLNLLKTGSRFATDSFQTAATGTQKGFADTTQMAVHGIGKTTGVISTGFDAASSSANKGLEESSGLLVNGIGAVGKAGNVVINSFGSIFDSQLREAKTKGMVADENLIASLKNRLLQMFNSDIMKIYNAVQKYENESFKIFEERMHKLKQEYCTEEKGYFFNEFNCEKVKKITDLEYITQLKKKRIQQSMVNILNCRVYSLVTVNVSNSDKVNKENVERETRPKLWKATGIMDAVLKEMDLLQNQYTKIEDELIDEPQQPTSGGKYRKKRYLSKKVKAKTKTKNKNNRLRKKSRRPTLK
jgi:hypothetical protein